MSELKDKERIAELEEQLSALIKDNLRLKDVLRFYAIKGNNDKGRRARGALR